MRRQILGEIPKNLGIVEALVFLKKKCQQILLGHENCPVALLLCYPTFCTAEHDLCFDMFSLSKNYFICKKGIFRQNLPTNLIPAK